MATTEFKSSTEMDSANGSRYPLSDRRAKIVCTLGPASNSEEMLHELMRHGMDVARLNFSHGTHEDHAKTIQRVRKVAAAQDRTICILQDLQGPKLRTGMLASGAPVLLTQGHKITLTGRQVPGDATIVSTTFPIAREVQPGARILLSDGLIELKVKSVKGEDVECEIINGGMLGQHKGINLPGTALSLPAMTEKDCKDLEFGVKHGVDAVALSFVRSANDVLEAKRLIRSHGHPALVIAKLEKPQAIDNLEEIFDVADGVMVARGDLGVEVPAEKVPIIQKQVIRRAAEWRKPVITATQMLESMIENPRPTRAEASDVANAIFDGSDAVMLSAETASGKYPREAVDMMARIIVEAEAHMQDNPILRRRADHRALSISETVCESVAHAAYELDMSGIAVFTQTGTTARLVSKYRPQCRIFGLALEERICNQLNLMWGVHPILWPHTLTAEDMLFGAERILEERGVTRPGQVIGVISGTTGMSGSTNLMRLHVVGSDRTDLPNTRQKMSRPRSTTERRRK
jgi:pyruvate kinase